MAKQTQLAKTLFRSLLRLNRQPHVLCSPFSLNPYALNIDKYLPENLQLPRNGLVNAEGVQAAIFHAFRTSKGRGEDFDEALRVLRELNAVGGELKDRYKQHVENRTIIEIVGHSLIRLSSDVINASTNTDATSTSDVVTNPESSPPSSSYEFAWHQVGDVVAHKTHGFRGVVIAWSVPTPSVPNSDTTVPITQATFSGSTLLRQQITVLVDESDALNFLKNGSSGGENQKNLDMETGFADVFEPVPTSLLKRITNKRIDIHFKSFDTRSLRYIPSDDLNFRFPSLNIDPKAISTSFSKHSNFGQNIEQIDVNDLRRIGRNMIETTKVVENTLEEYLNIFNHYGIQLLSKQGSNSSLTLDPATQHLHDVSGKVLESFQVAISEGLNATRSISSSYSATTHQPQFQKRINIGSKSLLREMVLSSRHESADRSKKPLCDRIDIPIPALPGDTTERSLPLSTVMQSTFSAIRNLSTINSKVDQFLQLRFQQRGVSFVENLLQKKDVLVGKYGNLNSKSAASPTSPGQLLSLPISIPAPTRIDRLTIEPQVKFSLGQVVQHLKFNYRGVISGFDQRPLTDVSNWEGVRGSLFGSQQPFYNVIPDEMDIEREFGENQYRERMYVAQENLALVDDLEEREVVNKCIPDLYEAEFDNASGTFEMHPLLQFCFPANIKSIESAQATDLQRAKTDENIAIEKHFETIQNALIDVFSLQKHAMIKSRLDHSYATTPIPITAEQRVGFEESIRAIGGHENPSKNFNYLNNYNGNGNSDGEATSGVTLLNGGGGKEEANTISMLSSEEIEAEIKRRDAEAFKIDKLAKHRDCLLEIENVRNSYRDAKNKEYFDRFTIPLGNLYTCMQEASNREDASLAEWYIWLVLQSHHSLPVSQLMRQGMSSLSRGGLNDAFNCFAEALTDWDPYFAEAANKLADVHLATGEPAKCLNRSQLSLALCGDNLGALSNQGSSLEALGDIEGSIAAFEKSMQGNPWLLDVPTIVKGKYLKLSNAGFKRKAGRKGKEAEKKQK